jgi:hypothetical protein
MFIPGDIMRRAFALILLLLSSSLSSVAQGTVGAPATREDILNLFQVMNLTEQMRQVMDSIAKQQREMIHESIKRRSPQITERELAKFDQLTSDIMKELPIESMLDDMIPVYQKHLNKTDVEAMSAFYSSPTGKKMLREMPAMTAESMQAAGPRIQAMMEKVMDRADRMAREEREQKKQPQRPATQKN